MFLLFLTFICNKHAVFVEFGMKHL